MNLIIFCSTLMSLALLIASNPLMILIIILTQTLLLCLLVWTLVKTSWFSFILFLIFLGGLMVLFIYVVSLASNEKFEINYQEMMFLFVMFLLSMLMMTSSSFFNKMFDLMSFNFYDQTMMIFSHQNVILTLMIMAYLLFVLVVAVKISSKYEGPLRNFI